jgi:transcriptional regulator with XRE-family HTH domain
MSWRERLRVAVKASGKKYMIIALDAGIEVSTLTRILSGKRPHPRLETVERIAHAIGENVGTFLGEEGFTLTVDEKTLLRAAAAILLRLAGE